MNLTKGTYYKHRYGGIYRLDGVGTSTVDGKTKVMVYTHIFPFEEQIWVRPIEQFTADRFTEISMVEAHSFMARTDQDDYQAIVMANKKAMKG